jgi:hypothetical protein
MSMRKKRLQLIRERHRELILAPRERVQMEAFQDDWDDFEYPEDEVDVRSFSLNGEDEE